MSYSEYIYPAQQELFCVGCLALNPRHQLHNQVKQGNLHTRCPVHTWKGNSYSVPGNMHTWAGIEPGLENSHTLRTLPTTSAIIGATEPACSCSAGMSEALQWEGSSRLPVQVGRGINIIALKSKLSNCRGDIIGNTLHLERKRLLVACSEQFCST